MNKLPALILVCALTACGGGSAEDDEQASQDLPPNPFGQTPAEVVNNATDLFCSLPALCVKGD